MTPIKNVTFIQHGKLTNVVGRIRYISDEKKQENLYAVYETVPRKYWRDLAKENQSDFRRSGTRISRTSDAAERVETASRQEN